VGGQIVVEFSRLLYIRRAVWGQFIKEAREKFEANKDITNEKKIDKLLDEGYAWVKANQHPDPYRSNPSPYKFNLFSAHISGNLKNIFYNFGIDAIHKRFVEAIS
jgi:hypothetical protein